LAATAILQFSLTGCAARPPGETRGVARVGKSLYQDGSFALLIGNGDYDYWKDLPNPTRDVQDVAGVLERVFGFQTRVERNLTRWDFDRVMSDWVGTTGERPDAQLLFYFAGHGHTLPAAADQQMGYILMRDTPFDDDRVGFNRLSVSIEQFLTYARQIKAHHTLFIFDSCFSGSIFDSRGIPVPEAIADAVRLPARQFITAGAADEMVPDDSHFKELLLELLERGGLYDKGYLTATELHQSLVRLVTRSNPAQHPQYGTLPDPKLSRGNFVFVQRDSPLRAFGERSTAPPSPALSLLWVAGGLVFGALLVVLIRVRLRQKSSVQTVTLTADLANREEEKKAFRDMLTGPHSVLIIHGPTAIGKTVLIDELKRSCPSTIRCVKLDLKGGTTGLDALICAFCDALDWKYFHTVKRESAPRWYDSWIPGRQTAQRRAVKRFLQSEPGADQRYRRGILTQALLKDLRAFPETTLFLFDTFEEAPFEVKAWVRDVLLDLASERDSHLKLVISGQDDVPAFIGAADGRASFLPLTNIKDSSEWVKYGVRIKSALEPERIAQFCSENLGAPSRMDWFLRTSTRQNGT
jgi:hypothetical protein